MQSQKRGWKESGVSDSKEISEGRESKIVGVRKRMRERRESYWNDTKK